MTELLRALLLWIGIGLALLASVVVAPDVPGRVISGGWRSVVAFAYRHLPFLPPRNVRVTANFSGGSKLSANPPVIWVDDFDSAGSVDERFQVLRNQMVMIRDLIADTHIQIREELTRQIATVTAGLESTQADVQKLSQEFRDEQENSSTRAARALLPVLFGILLSGAPEDLSHRPVLGWLLAIVGAALFVRCGIVLWRYYADALRQRTARRTAAAAAAAATGTS